MEHEGVVSVALSWIGFVTAMMLVAVLLVIIGLLGGLSSEPVIGVRGRVVRSLDRAMSWLLVG